MPRARGEARGEGERAVKQLDRFIARYSPDVARLARQVLAAMRRRLPGATELVYDNYNALAIGFGPGERSSDAAFSIAVYPRWVSLFFLKGARLRDPAKLLKGSGAQVRHIVIDKAAMLNDPAVSALMVQALAGIEPSMLQGRPRTIIKSISAKQRPRRPPAGLVTAPARAGGNRPPARTDRSRTRRPRTA